MKGRCQCGDGIYCSSHVIQSNGNDWRHYVMGDVWCDASTSSCQCNNTKLDEQTTCSEENKFCTIEGCKCSKSRNEYVIEGKSHGTCRLASDVCHNSGPDSALSCDGMKTNPVYSHKIGLNILYYTFIQLHIL